MLCGLHNQISSSAHSSVVQGHVEFLGFLKGDSEQRPAGPKLQLLSRGTSSEKGNCKNDESW